MTSGKLAVARRAVVREPKTKQAVELLGRSSCDGKMLLVLADPDRDGAVEKSFRNLPHVRIAYAGGLGTYDVCCADHMLVTADALDALDAAAERRPRRAVKGRRRGR